MKLTTPVVMHEHLQQYHLLYIHSSEVSSLYGYEIPTT